MRFLRKKIILKNINYCFKLKLTYCLATFAFIIFTALL